METSGEWVDMVHLLVGVVSSFLEDPGILGAIAIDGEIIVHF